jgi:nucleoside-diphosphate-sugar epimerase
VAVIVITGAGGFVGQRTVEDLARRGHDVIGVVRALSAASAPPARVVGDIGAQTDWVGALEGVEVVVHCAARAHVMHERATDPLPRYRAVNVEGTRRLAEQAARLGVRRLVYLSSVKAAGERSPPGRPLKVSDPAAPEDAYGISKREAELALLEVGAATGLETVIIRPPLVYGPGVKGNFLRLMGSIAREWPLPLGALDNRRSMVSLANLTDFISLCVESPIVDGRTFFVSDGEDLSTTSLARRMGVAIDRRARLLPVPGAVLSMLGQVTGKAAEIERLVGTLQVDLTDSHELLGWLPPQTVDQGLRETADWFRSLR